MHTVNFTDLSVQAVHKVLGTVSEDNLAKAGLNHFERDAFMGAYSKISQASIESSLQKSIIQEAANG